MVKSGRKIILLACLFTVPLKSKLTLETQTLRLDPWALMLETFEYRVSRFEKQGFLKYAKTWIGFEEMIYFSKEE